MRSWSSTSRDGSNSWTNIQTSSHFCPTARFSPGLAAPKLALGLYAAAPLTAFFVELIYGIFCWYVYRGGAALFALITIGNLANLSLLSPAIPGPEQYFAGRPMLLVTVIFVQIAVTLVLVGVLAHSPRKRT